MPSNFNDHLPSNVEQDDQTLFVKQITQNVAQPVFSQNK
jgi:hypothetical protein